MTEEDKKSPGYLSGFAIGAALGAAAMFFLGTKKGRRLARKLHQQGDKTVKDIKAKGELVTSHIQKLQAKGRATAAKYFQDKDPSKKS